MQEVRYLLDEGPGWGFYGFENGSSKTIGNTVTIKGSNIGECKYSFAPSNLQVSKQLKNDQIQFNSSPGSSFFFFYEIIGLPHRTSMSNTISSNPFSFN